MRKKTKITKSQGAAIARIRGFFDGSSWTTETRDLAEFTVKVVDGTVWIVCHTDDELRKDHGAFVRVGRRGQIVILLSYRWPSQGWREYLAYILGGTVGQMPMGAT